MNLTVILCHECTKKYYKKIFGEKVIVLILVNQISIFKIY